MKQNVKPDAASFLEKASALMQVRRYSEAEAAALRALVLEPGNDRAHALLGWARFHQERYSGALTEAQTAVHGQPTYAPYHYLLAWTYFKLRREVEAGKAIQEALRLDPRRAEYYHLLGNLAARRKDWPGMLKAAEAGLQLEPENTDCLNLRAMALVKVGRSGEAAQTLQTALSEEPENAVTHANQGWRLLHEGKSLEAVQHFRESLRLDPGSEWARDGLVEALRARNPLYRWLLRYSLWMSGFTVGEQWSVWMGIQAARTTLYELAGMIPLLWLLVLPVDLLYRGFVALSWIGRPLFALLVRFDRLGRQALSRDEIAASNALAACLLSVVVSGGLGLALRQPIFVVPCLLSLLLVTPVAGVYHLGPGKRRLALALYTIGMIGIGVILSAFALTGTVWGAVAALALGALFVFLRGLYFWLAIVLFNVGAV